MFSLFLINTNPVFSNVSRFHSEYTLIFIRKLNICYYYFLKIEKYYRKIIFKNIVDVTLSILVA